MDGMNRKDRFGLPPLPQPPRSRAPSTLVPPMPSQLGRQPQLMMISGGDGRRPFPEGLNRNIIPQNQSQHPENDPISTGLVVSAAGVGTGVTFRTESMTVSDARGTQPDPNMDDRRLRRLAHFCFHLFSFQSPINYFCYSFNDGEPLSICNYSVGSQASFKPSVCSEI